MRTVEADIIIAHHEAAHAVTCEMVLPGSLIDVDLDFFAENEVGVGINTIAICRHKELFTYDTRLWTIIAAGREGQKLVEFKDEENFCQGDDLCFKKFGVNHRQRRNARDRAKRIVQNHRDKVHLVASELQRLRYMEGDWIRAVLTTNAPYGAEGHEW